jgi:hypothetical protein
MKTRLLAAWVQCVLAAMVVGLGCGALAATANKAAGSDPGHGIDCGALVAGVSGDTAVWWCPATFKVMRETPLPKATSPAATIAAARNDYEAFQVVVRPARPLVGLRATVGPLVGPGGATIGPEEIEILRVYYHFVEHPTDGTGRRGYWPDALPPPAEPLGVAAGENQPLWVLVHVPDSAAPGDYQGHITLAAEGFQAVVQVQLHVWDFALPEQNHLETAFGFDVSNVFEYHQVKNEGDKRRLLDMYFESFARHRISPYDPTPLDPIRVRFLPEADPPRAELDFSAFDKEMSRVIEKFHFTGFRLPVEGIGGRMFHGAHVGQIGEYTEDTPEYKAMLSSYLEQLENHLRERGWLAMAYVYWFDEPSPANYAFVAEVMQRLKCYAPGLRRMLTEEPNEKLLKLNPCVDIWCPVSYNYNHQAAEERRTAGERLWWYVCCGPQAPYCTLFIDHPATDLRVWHWQTWQRNIAGTLVWQTNYWTSPTAFPDGYQDPYQDPMSYTTGYDVPKGEKRFWGNGDGRFLYPPLAASLPGKSGPGPVLQPPVSSIRWETLREGVEDYEYLYLLREQLNRRRANLPADEIKKIEYLLTVPESITKDMTNFTTDPTPIYERRAAVARMIERMKVSP